MYNIYNLLKQILNGKLYLKALHYIEERLKLKISASNLEARKKCKLNPHLYQKEIILVRVQISEIKNKQLRGKPKIVYLQKYN